MRLIKLTARNKLKRLIVDDDVYEIIKNYRIDLGTRNYPVINFKINRKIKRFSLHRIIAGATDGELVDHVSGYVLDNRRINLRICNHSENSQNRKKRSNAIRSKYKGVGSIRKGSFYAKIGFKSEDGKSKRLFLGTFKSEIEAHYAYANAAMLYHKGFARCGTKDKTFIPA